jgi:hypothetical protein
MAAGSVWGAAPSVVGEVVVVGSVVSGSCDIVSAGALGWMLVDIRRCGFGSVSKSPLHQLRSAPKGR